MGPTEQTTCPISWTTLLESFLPSYYYLALFYPLILVAIPTLPPATSTALWIAVPLWLVDKFKCMQTLAALCFLSLLVLVYFTATSAYIWLADGYTSAHADAPTPAELEDGTGSTPTTTEASSPLALTLRTLLDFVLNLFVVATYTVSRGIISFESPAVVNGAAAAVFISPASPSLGYHSSRLALVL
ncbi:hypothetical protein FB45DRAFT_1111876 [Roridomyces roridus]|uniref:Uncharacterized protein n=1 Tax=Roridomyces roridus TaxID=1738132 RepID=A0AAD7B8Y3_9AGAR|nr:hypothetical protein FB45DRAFT_1111876 [Roridomyces roridus]